MRAESSGSLLVHGADEASSTFGIFTERDYVHNIVPYDEQSAEEIPLSEVARYTSGVSKRTMQSIAAHPSVADTYRPARVTCVTRETALRDCLSLMLGNGLLYVPVTEDKKPIDIVSMRDINLFLSP